MRAPDTSVLLDAQDILQKVRELIDGLRMAGKSLLSNNRDKANSIVIPRRPCSEPSQVGKRKPWVWLIQ
jgi:hypothetical protein